MSRIGILVVLCLLSASSGAPLCSASGVDAANAGARAFKQGDIEKAKRLFKNALSSNELSKENYVAVNNQMCELLRYEGKIGEAIDCYAESLYLNPDNPVALLGRADLYNGRMQYENALEDLTRYVEMAPRDPRGYIRRGAVFGEMGNYDRALTDLGRAVRMRQGNAEAHIHRGNIYLKAGNYNLALADFEKAVDIDPESPYAYQAVAWFYAACPNPDYRDGSTAVELARKAVGLGSPDLPDPLFPATLAAAYAESGDYRKAVEIQKRAVALAKGGRGGLSETELRRRLELYERGQPYVED